MTKRKRKPSEGEVKRGARRGLAERRTPGDELSDAERNDLEFTARTGATVCRDRWENWRPTSWFVVHAYVPVRAKKRRVVLCLHDLPTGSVRCECLHGLHGVHYKLPDAAVEPRFAELVAGARRRQRRPSRVVTAPGGDEPGRKRLLH
jgi:hypothetical protein